MLFFEALLLFEYFQIVFITLHSSSMLLFYFWQETLLVHKDLVQTGALNELIVDLRVEGTLQTTSLTIYVLKNIHVCNMVNCFIRKWIGPGGGGGIGTEHYVIVLWTCKSGINGAWLTRCPRRVLEWMKWIVYAFEF